MGKTSLALAAARQIARDSHHGVWIADLSALKTSDGISQAIARAVGIHERGSRDPDEALVSYLRERRLLLLVDNCEHLIGACAVLLDRLLDACPDLHILATSREPLRIVGEVSYLLQPLPVPPAGDHASMDTGSYASVQLFLDRAQAVRPDFELTQDDAQAVAEICRRLDGIPLALELAASRATGLTPEQIAQRLRNNFELLIARGRARPDRHQTLRATLEWSHDLLSPKEQVVFRRLGAMAGSWRMAAAEFICGSDGVEPEEVAELVVLLVEKSLLLLDGAASEARHRFLAPVHEYAQGRLAASGEWENTRSLHCAFFVQEAEQAEPEMHRSGQSSWFIRLDHDLDNMRAAIRTAHARSDDESVMRLADALWWYLWLRGLLREGVSWLVPAMGNGRVSNQARLAD
jgi:predicted ATPase